MGNFSRAVSPVVEVLYPPSSLTNNVPVPLTWSVFPRENIPFGIGRDLKHPKRTGSISSVYPLTLLERGGDGCVRYLASAVCFFRLSSEGQLALRIERPTILVTGNSEIKSRLLVGLLDGCERIAAKEGASMMEVEAYANIGGSIAFPSTLSLYDSYNEPWVAQALLSTGFKKVREKYCLSLSLKKSIQLERIRTKIRPLREIEGLWSEGDHLMEEVHTLPQEWMVSIRRFNSFRFWREDPLRFIVMKEGGLLLKKIIGMAIWSPNLYQVNVSPKTRIFYLYGKELRKYLSRNIIGKIFKVIVDSEKNVDTYRELVYEAIGRMREFGVFECQIGNVTSNRKDVLDFLKEMGFKTVHILWDLTKKVKS